MDHPFEHLYKGGLWIKGLNGALELLGAVLILIAPDAFLQRIAAFLTRHDHGRGGWDRVHGMLARGCGHLAGDGHGFSIFYLASHGILKITLAGLLLHHVRAAFPVGIAIFGLLIAYELYRLAMKPGVMISAIVFLDLAILTLILLHGPACGN